MPGKEVIKPERLREGDTVAIVSPCGGAAAAFPHIFKNGVRNLEGLLRVKTKEYPTTRASREYLHAHPEKRAKDIKDAFEDPEVKAIFCAIGGDGDSIRVMKYVDVDAAISNPKIFMGLSDPTTYITQLNQAGLVTFYGPTMMVGMSQMGSLPKSFALHVKEMLTDPKPTHAYEPYKVYSSGYPEWSKRENVGKTKTPRKNSGWHWIQGDGKVKGRLFGGCADMLEMFKGSEFWPKREFWNDRILFMEPSENNPPPDLVRDWVRNYGMIGVLERISALLLAIPYDYTDEQEKEFERMLIRTVAVEFGRPDLPIITHMDFGHTDPKLILPLGINAEIDCKKKSFRLVEPWLL